MLDEIDPVDLSHAIWAMARFDSYPAPGLVDEVLATLPPQVASADPAVSLSSSVSIATDTPGYMPLDKHMRYVIMCQTSAAFFESEATKLIRCICPGNKLSHNII